MHFPVEMKTNCFIWLKKTKSPTKVKKNLHRRYGRNEEAPTTKNKNKRLKYFQEKGTLHESKHQRKCTVHSREIINCSEDEPKQSLRRVANQCNFSTTTMHRTIKFTEHKAFIPQIAHKCVQVVERKSPRSMDWKRITTGLPAS